jgi:hypothetical protein
LRWPVGLERKLKGAKAFYGVLGVATLVGLMINFTKLDPIKALVWAAIINGVSGPSDVFYDADGQRSKDHWSAASSRVLKSCWLGGDRYYGTGRIRHVSYFGEITIFPWSLRRQDHLDFGSHGGYECISRTALST